MDILKNALGPLGEFPHATGSGNFSKPVLFLRGLQSHYIPETAFSLMSTVFPRSETVNIDCGHWIVQEKPEEFRQGMFAVFTSSTLLSLLTYCFSCRPIPTETQLSLIRGGETHVIIMIPVHICE